jgi:hypothetical protein
MKGRILVIYTIFMLISPCGVLYLASGQTWPEVFNALDLGTRASKTESSGKNYHGSCSIHNLNTASG